MKRVRAAEQDFCTMESRPGRSALLSVHPAPPKVRRAVREGSTCRNKHRSVSVLSVSLVQARSHASAVTWRLKSRELLSNYGAKIVCCRIDAVYRQLIAAVYIQLELISCLANMY